MPRANKGFEIWLEPRTGTYQIRWYEGGRRRTRSTGTGNESEARAYFARFQIELARPDLSGEPSIAEILAAWCDHKPRISLGPTRSALKNLTRLVGHYRAGEFRPPHARAYYRLRADEGAKPGTVRDEAQRLRAALNWAFREELISRSPPVPLPPAAPPRSRWLTEPEAQALLEACGELAHLRLFVLLALNTAARSGAIFDLKWTDIDFAQNVVNYPIKLGGKKRVSVPMTRQLAIALKFHQDMAECDYVIEYAGRNVRSVEGAFKTAVAKAGIAKCTPHDLRRTAGSWMLQRNVPIELISAVLGHSSILITRAVYAHLLTGHLAPAVSVLDFGAKKALASDAEAA